MRTTSILGATAALLLLLGCGGGGGDGRPAGRGEVTGIVFDTNGKPVTDAKVTAGGRSTTSDSAGRYVLTGVSADDLTVRASLDLGSQEFFGQNLGRVYADESTPNVNITLFDSRDLIRVTGQVRDSSGFVVRGARVFARPTDGSTLSSASALTDRDGFYTIARLSNQVRYQVVASARDFGDDSAFIEINASTDDREQDLVLKNLTTTAPDVPTGLDAVAYTTPGAPTSRGVGAAQRTRAYEAIKRLRDPKRAARMKAQGRDTPSGRPISIDLTWNEYPFSPAVRPAGFIVYRDVPAPTVGDGYFLQDPLAVLFSDSDVNLLVGHTYTYSMRSVSTGFESGSNIGRSALSATVAATPLDDLSASASGRTVTWNGDSGASTYTVYVYDLFPDIDVTPVYTSPAQAGTSLAVPTASTPSGTTYYYVVVGARADGSALTFSDVGSFRP